MGIDSSLTLLQDGHWVIMRASIEILSYYSWKCINGVIMSYTNFKWTNLQEFCLWSL